jgi:hypothetical protein
VLAGCEHYDPVALHHDEPCRIEDKVRSHSVNREDSK